MTDLLPDALMAHIESAYAVRLGTASCITRGIESDAWRVETERGPVALLLYPAWRTFEELSWVHLLIVGVDRTVPEAVAPLAARDGATLFRHEDRLVALFPFVRGDILDRENPLLRVEAARLLARIHLAMLAIPDLGPRPASGLDAPQAWMRPPDPPELIDPNLDRTIEDLAAKDNLLTGPIHGDYYRGNVFTRDRRIVAVIDWTEARHDWLIKELAWCKWEFAKTRSSDDWHEDRARAYLDAYAAEGGPVPRDEYPLVTLFVRHRLREEIRLYHAALNRGLDWWNKEYFESEVRAFEVLRGRPSL